MGAYFISDLIEWGGVNLTLIVLFSIWYLRTHRNKSDDES